MYTKVFDYTLKINPDTGQVTHNIPNTYLPDEVVHLPDIVYMHDSQFTLLRFAITPTLPVNVNLKTVDVVWTINEVGEPRLITTQAKLQGEYICVVVPIEVINTIDISTGVSIKKYCKFTLVGYTENDDLLMFGVYDIPVQNYAGLSEIKENPDPDKLPRIDTIPKITLGNGVGDDGDEGEGGTGGDGGSCEPVVIEVKPDYTCYSDDKHNVLVGSQYYMSDYPYVAITDKLDDVNNIDWFTNPNHVSKLLDGLYTESQNFCMFDWATFVLTNTGNPASDIHKIGQISSGDYNGYVALYSGYYSDPNIDTDSYIANYYYRKLIGNNAIKYDNLIVFNTTTIYCKPSSTNPINFNTENLHVYFWNRNISGVKRVTKDTGYTPKTVTPYIYYSWTSSVIKLLHNTAIGLDYKACVISDYTLIANKTMFKNNLEPEQESFKINEVIKYTKTAKKEGWY